jgi:DNA repair exonuclease SbcCD nuclease subunit
MKTIQLLNEKNHFLEKFYSLNEKQLVQLTSSRFENIEEFYNQREDILNIIKYVDSEMARAQNDEIAMNTAISLQDQMAVKECLRIKDIYVSRIVEQDIQIISLIEQLKNDIITELKSVRGAKRAMAGYKSNMI